MGVGNPWPKGAMATPIIQKKCVVIYLLFINFKLLHYTAFTYFCNQIFIVKTEKWLGLKLFY